jgi:small nuclear ribonucleoprotein (snRNP)-like protein
MDRVCDDPIAASLLFYDRYRRARLKDRDFYAKVLKRYSKKPSSTVLDDLDNKYGSFCSVPRSVSLRQLQRIFSKYDVPVEFRTVILKSIPIDGGGVLWEQHKSLDSYFGDEYSEAYDVYSANFNADVAFTSNRHYLSPPGGTRTIVYDNMAKVKHLVYKDVKEFVVPDRSYVESVKAKQKANEILQRTAKPHLFQEIMDKVMQPAASSRGSDGNKEDAEQELPSPYRVIRDCIRDKSRASIVVRRKSGIKGVLTCYIKAADRHMNLLLADVDEVSAVRGRKAKISVLRKAVRYAGDVSEARLARMHFEQVLLRGDSVVVVSKA